MLVGAVGVHDVDAGFAVDDPEERQLPSAGHPGGEIVAPAAGRHVALTASVRVHDIDVGLAFAVADEGDRLPVR